MKLKHISLLAVVLAIASTWSTLHAQSGADNPPEVNFPEIYAWIGFAVITVVAIVVIVIDVRMIKDDKSATVDETDSTGTAG